MLGRLLEISIASKDPLAKMGRFVELGFREVATGDIWTHPYAVVSDGDLCIGIHGQEFDSPALTFVQPNLATWAQAYRMQNIELTFEKLASDEFNELGFVDPGEQAVIVLESRTFSPPAFDDDTHFLGRLAAIELPCNDAPASRAFWARLGASADADTLHLANIDLRLGHARHLTCHYIGDVLAIAEHAARLGLHNVTINNAETAATINAGDGLELVVSTPQS